MPEPRAPTEWEAWLNNGGPFAEESFRQSFLRCWLAIDSCLPIRHAHARFLQQMDRSGGPPTLPRGRASADERTGLNPFSEMQSMLNRGNAIGLTALILALIGNCSFGFVAVAE